jgi:IclR family transcriptional regulator, acetate operon repressor
MARSPVPVVDHGERGNVTPGLDPLEPAGSGDAGPKVSMLGRAAKILNAFGPTEWSLSLAELTRRSGLAKPTVHRLAVELSELGLLERTPQGFCLGMRLIEIGHRSWWQRGLRDKALPLLEKLREATHHTVNLAVLSGPDVVYLEKLPGPDNDVRLSRVGGRLPAHSTGLGKAILAFSSPDALRPVLASGLPRAGPRTITLPRMLAHELAQIRQRGVAFDIEEAGSGTLCVAAAVFHGRTRVLASLSVSGCASTMQLRKVQPLVDSAARDLSHRLSVSAGTTSPCAASG